MTTTVLVDANVFYSRTLRDWLALCYLEVDGWFEVMWTEDIMAEFIYHLRKRYPTASDRHIGGVRDQLVETFSTGRVAGYVIDADVPYPDIFDAHVHAAAVHARVDFLLTADNDFEQLADQLDDLLYEVHSPDSFFCLLDDSSPNAIKVVSQKQLDYWKAKREQFNLCTQLQQAGAPQFAERVRGHLQACQAGTQQPQRPRKTTIDMSWPFVKRA
ncbi:PIN domain-containing protein [Mycobacterium sp. pUA109]|uniref:PIN domain-containing protein n=1 Tax=Mycobacterium sp. pUA109 TaxID=3238982 RepID=UPI00351B95B1